MDCYLFKSDRVILFYIKENKREKSKKQKGKVIKVIDI